MRSAQDLLQKVSSQRVDTIESYMASRLRKKTVKKSKVSIFITFSMTSTYPRDPLFEIYTLV